MSGSLGAIVIGYAWRQRVSVQGAPDPFFPPTSSWAAHVRSSVASDSVVATLTTDNGGLVVVSDTEMDIVVSAAASASMSPGSVVLDLVRTDVDPISHCGFMLQVPVMRPVTRL